MPSGEELDVFVSEMIDQQCNGDSCPIDFGEEKDDTK